MDQQSIMAVVRAAAQALGGWLVSLGLVQGSAVEGLGGAAVVLASIIWSIAQKKGKVKA